MRKQVAPKLVSAMLACRWIKPYGIHFIGLTGTGGIVANRLKGRTSQERLGMDKLRLKETNFCSYIVA